MARWSGGLRCLLLLTAIAFIYTQVMLFKAQYKYAEKITAVVSSSYPLSQGRI
ncbi:hypothetical protein HanXRQr2_Chr16g0766661 [Helianthus annuus]|uniref:Uncharacterized protein n=1 Tax=Helianthus annuus TaxID=4232 RepID=A0A251S225_HELAN|nr:hypothetical protein HanXRQr2_Chr16g0766661 [Helianthus annuus]KAJ0439399.1 hypothetical protein HanHA300_Chr16g0624901 [Helianthus annuus]